MPGTFLSTYLAFLLQTGQAPAAPAPVAKAPAAKARPAAAAIVIESEVRDPRPTIAASTDLGIQLTTATAGAAEVATAPTADEVVDKVQVFYKDISQVTAKFRQVVINKTFGREVTTDGKLYIKKPGKMRWDYFAKKKKGQKAASIMKSFISDGKTLYVVDRQNKQVLEKNLEKNLLPVAVTFLYGKGDLKKDFLAELDTSKKYGGKGDLVLKLTPKTPTTHYKMLFLVVAKDNYRVKESVVIDGSGGVNHFRFYEPDFDRAIAEKNFLFDKKSVPDYRLVKGDEEDDAAAGGAE